MKANFQSVVYVLVMLSIPVVQGASAADVSNATKGLVGEWQHGDQKLQELYVLYPATVFNCTMNSDDRKIIGAGWGTLRRLNDNRIEINWQSGAKEVGKFTGVGREKTQYTIQSHTDESQVGVTIKFSLVQLPREVGLALAEGERKARVASRPVQQKNSGGARPLYLDSDGMVRIIKPEDIDPGQFPPNAEPFRAPQSASSSQPFYIGDPNSPMEQLHRIAEQNDRERTEFLRRLPLDAQIRARASDTQWYREMSQLTNELARPAR